MVTLEQGRPKSRIARQASEYTVALMGQRWGKGLLIREIEDKTSI